MYYCDPCGEKRGWPTDTLIKSMGPCEIYGQLDICNDLLSKHPSVPKTKLGSSIQDIQLGGDNDEEISSVDFE